MLREAGFRRPVVLFGPIADVANEKLASEIPNLFVIAKTEPKDAGSEKSSGVVRLNTIRQIIEQDQHALLDVTPKAVDTLNFTQWYPIVIFFNPDSKHGVKVMRKRISPNSNRSARTLHEQALKLRKTCSHLFTDVIDLNSANDAWYGSVKDSIRRQQMAAVWVSDGKLEGVDGEQTDAERTDAERLSFLSAMSTDYLSADGRPTSDLSADGRLTSDLDDTDNEPDTDGAIVSAIGRSSEPVGAEEVKVTEDLHHCQLPPTGRSYDSPLSSSPTSITNEAPLPSYQLNSFSKLQTLVAPQPPAKSGCGSAAEVTGHSSLGLPSAMMAACRWDVGAGHDSGGGNPSTTSFLSKIKALEKMDQFSRVPWSQELQEAHGARLDFFRKRPDIYAVPLKTAKLDQNQPQTIGSNTCPQTPPPSDRCAFYRRMEEAEPEDGFQAANLKQYKDTEL